MVNLLSPLIMGAFFSKKNHIFVHFITMAFHQNKATNHSKNTKSSLKIDLTHT